MSDDINNTRNKASGLRTAIALGTLFAGTQVSYAETPQQDNVQEGKFITAEAAVKKFENSGITYRVQEIDRKDFHEQVSEIKPNSFSALQETDDEDVLTYNVAGSFCRTSYNEKGEAFLQVEKGSPLALALDEAPLDLEEASASYPVKRIRIVEALQRRAKESKALSFTMEAAKYAAQNQK